MPQLNLNFNDIPIPETHLCRTIRRRPKIPRHQTLVRLLVKATQDKHPEQTND